MISLFTRLYRAPAVRSVLGLVNPQRPKAKTAAERIAEEDALLGWEDTTALERPPRFQVQIDRSTQFDRFTNGGHDSPRF